MPGEKIVIFCHDTVVLANISAKGDMSRLILFWMIFKRQAEHLLPHPRDTVAADSK